MSDYEGEITIDGMHQSYKFSYCPLNSKFTKFGAVYVVSRFDKSKNIHEIFYVGETDNISTRFNDHHKQKCFDENNTDYVCILHEENEQTRLQIEEDIIKRWKPICNDLQA